MLQLTLTRSWSFQALAHPDLIGQLGLSSLSPEEPSPLLVSLKVSVGRSCSDHLQPLVLPVQDLNNMGLLALSRLESPIHEIPAVVSFFESQLRAEIDRYNKLSGQTPVVLTGICLRFENGLEIEADFEGFALSHETEISAFHHLDLDGADLHGHNMRVQAKWRWVRAEFGDLKFTELYARIESGLKDIRSLINNSYLNNFISWPSGENLALFVKARLLQSRARKNLVEVTIQETAKNAYSVTAEKIDVAQKNKNKSCGPTKTSKNKKV